MCMYAGCSCPTSSAAEQRSCNICGVVKPVSGFTGANKNCILCLANVKARRQQRACRAHPSTSSDASNDLLPSASCCTLDDSLHAHMHILHEFLDTFPAHCQEQLREVLSYDIMRNKEECLLALDLLLHLLGQGAGCTDPLPLIQAIMTMNALELTVLFKSGYKKWHIMRVLSTMSRVMYMAQL